MAPNETVTKIYREGTIEKEARKHVQVSKVLVESKKEGWFHFKTDIIWPRVFYFAALHLGFLYALLTFSFTQNLKTTLWLLLSIVPAAIGVTGGVHRLWTHRSYKAKWPLRVILLLSYLMAGQNPVYDWVRDHRVHHKYTETDADPHDSRRGFFFAHVGWLMLRKHPEVIEKGRQIDMSDILADPIVQFGDKYFRILSPLFTIIIPVLVPVYFWNETWSRAIMSQVLLRHTYTLNCTWSVNSAAHIWGSKPYDKTIAPSENRVVSFLAYGEGWHNYHHIFPWDYKTAEFGDYSLNFTTMFLDVFAKIGWAYDLKQPSKKYIDMVASKRGDGTRNIWIEAPEENQIKVK